MPARQVKTLLRNPYTRKHREHRSKKGRSYRPDKKRFIQVKKKRERLWAEEVEKEVYED